MKSLIVDDEPAAREKLTAILRVFGESHAIDEGHAALQMFRKALWGFHPYDLVTIDIEMPGMNGLMLLRRLCEEEARAGTGRAKKIMVSGSSNPAHVMQAALQHCDGFIVKPVRRRQLLERLAAMGFALGEVVPTDANAGEETPPPAQ